MTPRLILHTVTRREDGCFSVLLWDERPFAVSVERTFENRRVVVPGGLLTCKRSFYNKGGYPTFEIIVPGHTDVLFHKGNKEEHSLGCIIVARSFDPFYAAAGGNVGVLDSKGGFESFMRLTEGLDQFDMAVINR